MREEFAGVELQESAMRWKGEDQMDDDLRFGLPTKEGGMAVEGEVRGKEEEICRPSSRPRVSRR